MASATLADLTKAVIETKERYETLKEQVKEAKDKYNEARENLRNRMIEEDLEVEGFEAHGYKFYFAETCWPRVEDFDRLALWCEKENIPLEAFTMVSAKKLQSFCRAAYEDGSPYPEGVQEWEPQIEVRLRKIKGGP